MMAKPPIGHKALRVGRVSEAGRLYFITKATTERVSQDWPAAQQQSVGRLVQPGVPAILLESLAWLQERGEIQLHAYCMMPDHLHLLFQLGDIATLSHVMQQFGAFTGKAIYRHTGRGHLWSEGYYDHALRGEAALAGIIGYIHDNPVRSGLVFTPEAWPWSSVHWIESETAANLELAE